MSEFFKRPATPPPSFFLLGAAVLVFTWWFASQPELSTWEAEIFGLVNDLPDVSVVTWPIMQAGAGWFIPVAALAALAVWRSPTISVKVLAAGSVAWLAARSIKEIVRRGRPQDFLPDALLRPELGGLGFISGHTAVAFALASIVSHHVERTGRWIAYAVAATVGLLRMHVGAHLPLDVVGGAIVGVFVGSAVEYVNSLRAGHAAPE